MAAAVGKPPQPKCRPEITAEVTDRLREVWRYRVADVGFDRRRRVHRLLVVLDVPKKLAVEVAVTREFCHDADVGTLHQWLRGSELVDRVREGRNIRLHWNGQIQIV